MTTPKSVATRMPNRSCSTPSQGTSTTPRRRLSSKFRCRRSMMPGRGSSGTLQPSSARKTNAMGNPKDEEDDALRLFTESLAADIFTEKVSKAEVDQDLRDAGGDPEAI